MPRIQPSLLRNVSRPFPPLQTGCSAPRWYSTVEKTSLPLVVKPMSRRRCYVAIIGSGPAGFYTAQRILKRLPKAKVDMYESLPVPYGLVRYGVAPDHPEVKNVQNTFERTANSPNFKFIGNVSFGTREEKSIDIDVLRHYYDAIVFAYGASLAKKLGIPGEDANGVYSAGAFVNWYNGLPSHRHLHFNLGGPSHVATSNGKRAIIIGHGNVALDVARILLTPLDLLAKTDMPQYAYRQLANSNVKHVTIVGRRGPVQAAFTTKELREVMRIPGVAFRAEDRIPTFDFLPRPQLRMMKLLRQHKTLEVAEKSITLKFCLKPKRFLADENNLLIGMEFIRQWLEDPSDIKSNVRDLAKEDEPAVMTADLVFTSIGYSSLPLWGMEALGINLVNGLLPNDAGRVKAVSTNDFGLEKPEDARMGRVDGIYASGWIKTGPTGVILSTMLNAFETGDSLVQDWKDWKPFLQPDSEEKGWDGFKKEVEKVGGQPVEWDEWKKIEVEEVKRGHTLGKDREKIVDAQQMLALATGHAS